MYVDMSLPVRPVRDQNAEGASLVLRVPTPHWATFSPSFWNRGCARDLSSSVQSTFLMSGSETFYQDFDADVPPGLPPRSLIRGSPGPVALEGVRDLGGNGGARADQSCTRREKAVSQGDRPTCSGCARALGVRQGNKGRANRMKALG